MNVIAVINQKGGVGKTTTSVNLAACLARMGKATLLVDMDPQAHATVGVGIEPDQINGSTIGEVLLGGTRELQEIILETYLPNLKIAPAAISLAKADAQLHAQHFREQRLSEAVSRILGFEYVIIDCQPTLGVLPVNAMVAARYFLIPTQPSGYGIRGLGDLLETLQVIKRRSEDWDYRILLTMVMGQATVTNDQVRKILEPLNDKLLKTQISRNETLNRAQIDEPPKDIVEYDKNSRGARDYQALTKEIFDLWPSP
jgi:chromosome partitioning protein